VYGFRPLEHKRVSKKVQAQALAKVSGRASTRGWPTVCGFVSRKWWVTPLSFRLSFFCAFAHCLLPTFFSPFPAFLTVSPNFKIPANSF